MVLTSDNLLRKIIIHATSSLTMRRNYNLLKTFSMGYPDMPLVPKIMLRQEKVKKFHSVWHSGRIPELCPELTRFGITHVQVKIDAIFLQILKAFSID